MRFVRNSARLDDFNPRSREGSDVYMLEGYSGLEISIHAPAKGATVTFWIT